VSSSCKFNVRRSKPLSMLDTRRQGAKTTSWRATTHRRLGLLDTPYINMNNPRYGPGKTTTSRLQIVPRAT
jgi:hypothetical protein